MGRITDLQALVAVIERGSLTARQLHRSLQSVSRSLATLEQDLAVELVRRTTRRSSATDVGRALCRRLGAALAEIEDAECEASRGHADPAGLLRVTTSTAFGALYLVPYLRIEFEFDLSDRYVDLVAEGLDLAVRIGDVRCTSAPLPPFQPQAHQPVRRRGWRPIAPNPRCVRGLGDHPPTSIQSLADQSKYFASSVITLAARVRREPLPPGINLLRQCRAIEAKGLSALDRPKVARKRRIERLGIRRDDRTSPRRGRTLTEPVLLV